MFFVYLLIGMAGQLVDGSLGMAYGVTCNTFLRIFTGLPASATSSAIHFSEIFTTCASSVSHIRMKNVDMAMLVPLAAAGITGGIAGAVFLSSQDLSWLECGIDLYMLFMGIQIIRKVFEKKKDKKRSSPIWALGALGGFSDAVGGGGWGPVVTSNLILSDCDVRKTVGTVSMAEFFVTIAETAVFIIMGNSIISSFPIMFGLIAGGVLISPFAARLCVRVPRHWLLLGIGILLFGMNLLSLSVRILSG